MLSGWDTFGGAGRKQSTACLLASITGMKGANTAEGQGLIKSSAALKLEWGVCTGGLMGRGVAHSHTKNLRYLFIPFLPVGLRGQHCLERVCG